MSYILTMRIYKNLMPISEKPKPYGKGKREADVSESATTASPYFSPTRSD